MKNWLLIALLLCVGLGNYGLASPAPQNEIAPLTVRNVIENPTGVTIELDFPAGELVTIGTGDESRLWLNTPGSIADFDAEGPALPVITKLIAVPDGYRVEARVVSRHEVVYDAERVLPRDAALRGVRQIASPPAVEVGDPCWIRWLRAAPVVIHPARYDAREHRIFASNSMVIEFDFIPDGTASASAPDPDRYWSQDFELFFQGMLLNPGSLPNTIPGGHIIQRGSYLIITDEALSRYAEPFADWKRRKGFEVHIIDTLYYDGISPEEIKDFIQNAYDNWDRPPEYVLLVGDIDEGNMHMPAFYIESPDDEDDVTDHPYVLLEGDDYFPDAFIGRISTNSPTSEVVRNVFNRILNYEQQTYRVAEGEERYEEYIAQFSRATIFAGNFGDGGVPVISPVETSMWLAERLKELGWDVEEFYYRSRPGDTRHSDPIIRSINRGVNIVSYRGWGDANGTHFPEFYKSDLDRLSNGPLLPVMTFFVCNTGDFGNEYHITCFGEHSITRGTINRPAGAIAFFGPSDLHTKTRYNNALLAGYYTPLMYNKMRTLGALTLNAKMEIWRGFPWEREMGGRNNIVEFYFNIYNVLGDPELNVYFNPPRAIDVSHTEELAVGATHVPFTVHWNNRPVHKAMVNLYKENEVEISVLTDREGIANVPVQLLSQGELTVTVISYQAAPYLNSIPVNEAARMIGIESVTVSNEFDDDRMVTGSPVEFRITLRNFGQEAASGVTATLSSNLNSVSVLEDETAYGNIAAGGTSVPEEAFVVEVEPRTYAFIQLPFYLSIRDSDNNEYQAQFRLPAITPVLKYRGHSFENGVIEPGETDNLIVRVLNHGPLGVGELHADLHSFDEAVEVLDAEATFPALAIGETADNSGDPFRIHIRDEAVNGRRIELRTNYYDSDDRLVGRLFFNITAGVVGPSDPLGPDRYGYYAYDNTDDERYGDPVPVYNWIELDPDYDGAGAEHHAMRDDATFWMELPFTFQFYGRECSSIAICSNGWFCFDSTAWFSFDSTWMANFRNWQLPSPLGPHLLVAPFWEDLVGQMMDDHRNLLDIFTRYDDEQGWFIIEWSRVVARTDAEDFTETFEAILYDPAMHHTPTGDGEILFQYQEVSVVDLREGNFATVGIEDWNHFTGLEVTYAGQYDAAAEPLRAGRAIKFTTVPPDPFIGLEEKPDALPLTFELSEPYPNPFNSSTSLSFTLPNDCDVNIGLWNINGRLIQNLIQDSYITGRHFLTFEANKLPSGLYLIRLEANGSVIQRKALLLR